MRAAIRLISFPLIAVSLGSLHAQEVRTGAAAFGTWEGDAPGVSRHIRPTDMPRPTLIDNDPEEPDFRRLAKVVQAPQGKVPDVPKGFAVQVFARGLNNPASSGLPRTAISSWRKVGAAVFWSSPADAARGAPATPEVFAENLDRPYGIVFQPPSDPQYVYVAAADQVVRFPYNGDRKATGAAEVVIPNIPTKRHWTRDLAVSRDGETSLCLDRLVYQCRPRNARRRHRRKFKPMKRRMGLARPGAMKRTVPMCGCSIRKVRTSAIMRPVCAIAPAWPCSRAPTLCGARETNATISAPIWRLIS